eukprot:3686508-Rhodomonas_salina.1
MCAFVLSGLFALRVRFYYATHLPCSSFTHPGFGSRAFSFSERGEAGRQFYAFRAWADSGEEFVCS